MESSISGLTMTVKETNPADYGRTTSQTMDALGNTTSSTDKGGIVWFSYNAADKRFWLGMAIIMLLLNMTIGEIKYR